MSRHESVSCDSCLKGNFRGKRYKCLICFDYDLCAACYEAGAMPTTSRHTADHPMQCILTRADFDIYYGGEAVTAEQPQSFTCPYCAKMGFTELTLQEHVTSNHADSSAEVVCPICAALPGGEPNNVTDEFAAHLTLEHRTPRDFDEPMGGMRHVRRIPHPNRGGSGGVVPRTRRTNMQFHSTSSALSGGAPAGREAMDPIAELLSQLSSVRSRAAAAQSVSSQLQQLEMQLQSTRQQLERLPRRQLAPSDSSKTAAAAAAAAAVAAGNTVQAAVLDLVTGGTRKPRPDSQYLLARLGDQELSDSERQTAEQQSAERSVFVQELLLSSLAEEGGLPDSEDVVELDTASPRSIASPENCVKTHNKQKPDPPPPWHGHL